jgi:HEPN domain-containing protein
MLKSKRYLYVGFMCHQVIEKIFKAYYVSTTKTKPPYTHNLIKLAKSGNFYDELTDDEKNFLDILAPLNIEARYPTNKEKLLKSLTAERCKKILKDTEELYKWIGKKL